MDYRNDEGTVFLKHVILPKILTSIRNEVFNVSCMHFKFKSLQIYKNLGCSVVGAFDLDSFKEKVKGQIVHVVLCREVVWFSLFGSRLLLDIFLFEQSVYKARI
jgi:hypothetical protein